MTSGTSGKMNSCLSSKSYSQVAIPNVQAERRWVKGVGRGCKNPLQAFPSLYTCGGDHLEKSSRNQVYGTRSRSEAQQGRIKLDKTIVLGDLMDRGAVRRFGDPKRTPGLPGMRDQNVSERLQNKLQEGWGVVRAASDQCARQYQ